MKKNIIQWSGHATFKITSTKGKIIYIDPWIKENPQCPIDLGDIDKVDIILITHDHFDHVGNTVEIAKKTGATVVCQPELAKKLKRKLAEDQIINSGEGMNIGGSVEKESIKITMVQAFHSAESGSPAGYIIRMEDGKTIYHAGDTGIFQSMELLGNLYRIDVALLPIGGCFTMDPLQAAYSLKLLKPKIAIPMHYKTFPILVQDATDFVEKAKKLAPGVKVVVLKPGESYKI
jgi:L-ascorbate metabolism protein UlaG (beta-lactamase superfamily)